MSHKTLRLFSGKDSQDRYNVENGDEMIPYGFYLLVAAILTGFITILSISQEKLSMKFAFLVVGLGLFVTIAIGVMQ